MTIQRHTLGFLMAFTLGTGFALPARAKDIVHDAEYYSERYSVCRTEIHRGWLVHRHGAHGHHRLEGPSGGKVTFPIGLGIIKTFRWLGVPWKVRLEPQYSIVRLDAFGTEWNIRLQIAPVIPSPFK